MGTIYNPQPLVGNYILRDMYNMLMLDLTLFTLSHMYQLDMLFV